MQKKALVLALSAAFAVTMAHAAKGGGAKDEANEPDSVVELYGKLYPEMIRPSSSGSTPAGTPVATFAAAPTGATSVIKRNEMESSNSRFGVRGTEKLGPELRATWQLETQFLVDSNNTAFAQRDSWVGLQHSRWGTIKLGRFDTPFKEYGDDISFLGVSSGNFTSTSAVLRRPGFGSSNNSRFHERAVNATQYESPEWGGLDFKAQYSTFETDSSSPPRRPHFWSFGAKYAMGPFAVLVAHEIHWDRFGLSSNVPVAAMSNVNDPNVRSKDKATSIAFTAKFGAHQFEVDANEKRYDEPGATVTGRARAYKNNSYLALWDARWNKQWRTQVHYVKGTAGSCERVLAVCTTMGLGGSQTSAGVAYYFSPKTYAFLMASWIKNDFSAQFNNENQQSIAVGEDVRQVALGINTAF
jgi:predicted porin